jgi:hypothetical protein
MRNCSAITTTGAAATREAAACDVLSTADARRTAEVPQQLVRLSQVVRLRARAIDRLAAAYRALSAEADFDAQGQFQTAIAGATESASALGTAVGLGALPQLVGEVLRIGGGQLATSAQQRRLVRGSAQLRVIAEHVRAALAAEQALHQEADIVVGEIDIEARRHLAEAGLAQPLPPLKEVVAATGFPSPGDSALQAALQRNQRLTAAALVAGLAGRPGGADEALAASIQVLDALIREHQDFEARRGLSLADLTAAVARLTELVAAARADLEDEETGAAPASGGEN